MNTSLLPGFLASKIEARKTPPPNERSIEYAYVFKALKSFNPRTILDVGTGRSPLPALVRLCGINVTAIDVKPYKRFFDVKKGDITKQAQGKYDMVLCVSTIEHIKKPITAFGHMVESLNHGGILIITCPYYEWSYRSNVYLDPLSNAYDHPPDYVCRSYGRVSVNLWMAEAANSVKLIHQEYWRCWEGKLWSWGERLSPVEVIATEPHQLSCMTFVKVK